MAIERFTNPALIPLQVTYQDFEGRPKLDILTVSVRVYHVTAGGAEVNDLAPTALVRIGASSTWRYNWVSPPLTTPGAYVAEYKAADPDIAERVDIEDITIFDQLEVDQLVLAKLTALDAKLTAVGDDVGTVIDSELGRWFLNTADNTLTLFRLNGSVLKVYDLKNDLGLPDTTDVFDRIPR